MATLSMGGAEWIPVDLEPGTYVLDYFVPDIQSGIPHAYLGMYDVVTVGDEGTPTSLRGLRQQDGGNTGPAVSPPLETWCSRVPCAEIPFRLTDASR